MPMLTQNPPTSKAGNKRKPSSCSYTAALPSRKQSTTFTTSYPTTANPTKDTQKSQSRRSTNNNADPSLRTILESRLNSSLDPWLADQEITPSQSQLKQELQPSTTYIYMQLDPEDLNSYVCVPLPPSFLAQITTPPSSPGRSTTKNIRVEIQPSLSNKEACASLRTPPQTPPRISPIAAEMVEH